MVQTGPDEGAGDDLEDLRDKGTLVVVGALLLFAPALIIVVTIGFLQLVHEVAITDLTPLELVELYLIEMALLAAFAYLVFRILRWSTRHKLPEALDSLEAGDADEESERRD